MWLQVASALPPCGEENASTAVEQLSDMVLFRALTSIFSAIAAAPYGELTFPLFMVKSQHVARRYVSVVG